MNLKVEKYQMSWHAGKNEGTLILLLEGGTTANLPIDSAEEGSFLIDMLRNEDPVLYDSANGLILTGFEPVGEGERAMLALAGEL